MTRMSERALVRAIHAWESSFLRYPWLVVLAFVVACGFCLRYSLDHLKVDTDTADMISIEVPFQKNRLRLEKAFPQDVSTIVLLVEGKTPETTAEAVKQIGSQLRAGAEAIKSVYIPDEGDFFARNGLLYLKTDELEDLTGKLASAQPFIGRLAEDNSLDGLLGILTDAVKNSGDSDFNLDMDPVLKAVRDALLAATEGRNFQVSWQQLMMSSRSGLGITKRFIVITPELDFDAMLPAEKPLATIARILKDVTQGDLADVVVRTTGEVVLEHEEMQTLGVGVSFASGASLILVCVTLWFAYRSFKLMIATFVSLSMGLIFSLGFATVAIGTLNLISIGFAVLFIGMGDAYSSHFCLRYRELLLRGMTSTAALRGTLTSTGASLILSTFTAALGLYAFIPTAYSGVAELGIIAGTSMFIALATTFTVLPALMKVMPIKLPTPAKVNMAKGDSWLVSNWPLCHARAIQGLTLLLALASLMLLPWVTVDFNPINLRDPNTESVKTFKYLLKSEDTSPMTVASLASSAEEAKSKEQRFEALPLVDRVMSVLDMIPDEQEDKLTAIGDLAVIMGPQLENFRPVTAGPAKAEKLVSFHQAVATRRAAGAEGIMVELDDALTAFNTRLESADSDARQKLLDTVQNSLLAPLPTTINSLRESLKASPITMENLPKDIIERWVSADGLYRLQIFPKKDLNDLDNLREFIRATQQVDSDVTDLPVTYLESMNEVLVAFRQAFAIALVATTLLLLAVLRSVRDTLLVLLPLILASLFTAAMTVLLKVPFNFANIIALPLLFGLGVDSGIHMAHRLHYLKPDTENLLGSSEAQGVFFGSLTTVFSFSSLAFTAHQGTASMGLLLAIGLLLTLVCALVVLPAFSVSRVGRRA